MKRAPTVDEQLARFIAERQSNTGLPNAWLEDYTMNVFIRHGHHAIENELRDCLDIANVAVKSDYLRQGYFKRFVQTAERLCPWQVIFLENVLDVGMREAYERWGYTRLSKRDYLAPCFYKRLR